MTRMSLQLFSLYGAKKDQIPDLRFTHLKSGLDDYLHVQAVHAQMQLTKAREKAKKAYYEYLDEKQQWTTNFCDLKGTKLEVVWKNAYEQTRKEWLDASNDVRYYKRKVMALQKVINEYNRLKAGVKENSKDA